MVRSGSKRGMAKKMLAALRAVRALMHDQGKGELQAFMLSTLHDDATVTVAVSEEIRNIIAPSLLPWASLHMPAAYQLGGGTQGGYLTVQQLNHLIGQKPREWIVKGAFRIDNAMAVTTTILNMMHILQQGPLRTMAKAWIKGICPRKQAKYPYRNKAGEEKDVPPWWPHQDICQFREPDHIDKRQRMGLYLHLARLRPTAEQRKDWSGEDGDTKQPLSWTEFLRSLAPPTIAGEVGIKNAEEVERRRQILEKMYAILAAEQDFYEGVIDGDTKIQPLAQSLRKPVSRTNNTKRSRRSSTSSSTSDDEENDSDDSRARTAAKKMKTSADASSSAVGAAAKHGSKMPSRPNNTAERSEMEGQMSHASAGHSRVSYSPYPPSTYPSYDPWMGSTATTPLDTSFASGASDTAALTPVSPGADFYQAWHPQNHMQDGIHVHGLYDLPEPTFDTMPNTPVPFSSEAVPLERQRSSGMEHDVHMQNTSMPAEHEMQGYAPHFGYHHAMHGLPPPRAPQYQQWPVVSQDTVRSYTVHPGVPSADSRHAAFAVPDAQDTPGCATFPSYQPHHNFHRDNDMKPNPVMFGPHDDLPPAPSPAEVVRGFTGHASGVGDSACPPGAQQYFA